MGPVVPPTVATPVNPAFNDQPDKSSLLSMGCYEDCWKSLRMWQLYSFDIKVLIPNCVALQEKMLLSPLLIAAKKCISHFEGNTPVN